MNWAPSMSWWTRSKAAFDCTGQKEVEENLLKEIDMMDVEVEASTEVATSTENLTRMEEAANIAASAFGDDHISVRAMRQEITNKRMERKVKQTTLFQFVKKSSCDNAVFMYPMVIQY